MEVFGGWQTVKRYAYTESPLGRMLMTADERALTGLYFVGQKYEAIPALDWIEDPDHPVLEQARTQLAEYFAGHRTRFDLRLAPSGTPFQRGVWRALELIPSGTTTSYGELARSLGAPESVRAVGAAVGRNPISIVVPCHRVVGSTGSLTGYAGGLERKRALLALEGSGSHARQAVLL
jgi:methylated-DNA-[protein]-cysteine S-methyltransferase